MNPLISLVLLIGSILGSFYLGWIACSIFGSMSAHKHQSNTDNEMDEKEEHRTALCPGCANPISLAALEDHNIKPKKPFKCNRCSYWMKYNVRGSVFYLYSAE